MKYSKADQAEAREYLMRVLKPGSKVFTILRHVSRSGMSRDIDLYLLADDGRVYLSYSVAVLVEYPRAKDGSLKVGGCGMDMGFHVVNSLSYALFHEYTCTGEAPEGKHQSHGCKSGDHVNSREDEKGNRLPPFPRDGKMKHKDGYALIQEWL